MFQTKLYVFSLALPTGTPPPEPPPWRSASLFCTRRFNEDDLVRTDPPYVKICRVKIFILYILETYTCKYNNTMLLPNSKNVGLPHFVRVVIELFFRAPNHRRRMYCYWIRHDPCHSCYHFLVYEIRYSDWGDQWNILNKNNKITRYKTSQSWTYHERRQLLPTYLMIKMKAAARQNWPT